MTTVPGCALHSTLELENASDTALVFSAYLGMPTDMWGGPDRSVAIAVAPGVSISRDISGYDPSAHSILPPADSRLKLCIVVKPAGPDPAHDSAYTVLMFHPAPYRLRVSGTTSNLYFERVLPESDHRPSDDRIVVVPWSATPTRR